jgi:hypothetical protein
LVTDTKNAKWPQIIPNGRKIYIPISSVERPSKIYPNLDFFVWKYTLRQPCSATQINASTMCVVKRGWPTRTRLHKI